MARQTARPASPWPALGAYLGLSAAWVGAIELVRHTGLKGSTAWLLQHALPAAAALLAAWLIARHWVRTNPRGLLSLGRPAPAYVLIAVVAALPALGVVGWHAADDPRLLSADAAWLSLKIAINQGLLEEWLARGLLLGGLLLATTQERRALWLSAVAFGVMHMLQFLVPPYTAERLINGVVLVALTTPIGALYAWLTLRARSLWPAVVLHFLTDLPILPQKLGTPNHALIGIGTLGSHVLAALLLYLYVRRQRRTASAPTAAPHGST